MSILDHSTRSIAVFIGLAGVALLAPTTVPAQEAKEPDLGVMVEASVAFRYGDTDHGRLDLDSKIGMVAPGIRIWLPGRKFGISFLYLSGDFDGSETVPVPDGEIAGSENTFGSRKELNLSQAREDVQLQALYRPFSWFTISAGYQYLELQTDGMVDLISDVRIYGSGSESYVSKARGLLLGIELDVPLHSSWTLRLAGQAAPWMDTEVSGNYLYMLPLQDRTLGEDWLYNGSAGGYLGEATLQYTFPSSNVALRAGYVYHRVESQDDIPPTWVDQRLGQESRDWQTNIFQGFSGGVVFYF